MRVAHFNTSDEIGGAARACSRLHRALVQTGCDSRLFVLNKAGTDERTERVARSSWYSEARQQFSGALMNAILYYYRSEEGFSYEYRAASASTPALIDRAKGAQIVNLHYTRGLLTSGQAARIAKVTGARVVITMMDMGPITGGCHYTRSCTNYQRECGRCPEIRSNFSYDVTRRAWRSRKRNYTAIAPTVVACNRWSRDRAHESSLLGDARCEIIPLATEVNVFRPIARATAREVLGLPANARLVFCGALKLGQTRKGFDSLVEAFNRLPSKLDAQRVAGSPVVILTAGNGDFARNIALPFAHHHLGLLGDDRSLALAYSAADVFVSPSLQDAGPMMVNESLACGTPVVSYDIGTAADHVEQGANGWLAKLGDADELAHGLAQILDSNETERLRVRSREVAVDSFSPDRVARKYLDLYNDLASVP